MKIGEIPLDIVHKIAIDAFEADPFQQHQDFSTLNKFLHEAFSRIRREYPQAKSVLVAKEIEQNRQIKQFLTILAGQQSATTLTLRPRIYFDEFDTTEVVHRLITQTNLKYDEIRRISRQFDLDIDLTRLLFALSCFPFTAGAILVPCLLLVLSSLDKGASNDDVFGRFMTGFMIILFSVQFLLLLGVGTHVFHVVVANLLRLLKQKNPRFVHIHESWQVLTDQE